MVFQWGWVTQQQKMHPLGQTVWRRERRWGCDCSNPSWTHLSQVENGLGELSEPLVRTSRHRASLGKPASLIPLSVVLVIITYFGISKNIFLPHGLLLLCFHQNHQLVQKLLRLDELQDLREMQVPLYIHLLITRYVQSAYYILASDLPQP